MPEKLRRYYGCGDLHFITFLLLVMPEHVHLLIGESEAVNPSTVVQSLKLRVSKRLRAT